MELGGLADGSGGVMDSPKENVRVAVRQALIWVINVIGITGIFLIAYSIVAATTKTT